MFTTRAKTSLLGLALAASMGIGVLVGFAMPDDDLFELRKNLRIFGAVYEKVVTGYVEPVDPSHLMRVGVEAMLNELDPYTSFIDESQKARIDIITEGQYGGVGLQVGRRAGKIAVVSPVPGASGYEEGVRTGDVITKVAGQPTTRLSLDDVKTLMRGEPGSTVRITVKRVGEPAPLTFTLTREQVELPDVTYRGRIGDEKKIGYVKLERFTRDAPGEVESALQKFQATGGLQGVVLDLRDNPGGLLRAAVRITALFVPKGAVVVSTRGRRDSVGDTFRSERAPLLPDVPLVILVNGESASASEIVAGAIQDHDRGVVMGTTTYGKGLVQKVRSLPHNTALKITTAQYYTPSGRTIQNLNATAQDSGSATTRGQPHETTHGRTVRDGDGIRPDVRVQAPSPSALEKALTRRAAFFRYANNYAATHDTLASDFAVTGADLSAFRTWLDRKGLRYPTQAQRLLDSLRAQIETSGYEGVRNEVAALANVLKEVKQTTFDRHASELKRHLKREILARYVRADRQVAALLPGDVQVTAATKLLHNADRYERILTPQDEQ
ncbi:MAG: S41 family peptidase [Salinibacter sp.]